MRHKAMVIGLVAALLVTGCGGVRNKCGDPESAPLKDAAVAKCAGEPAGDGSATLGPQQTENAFEHLPASALPPELEEWKGFAEQSPTGVSKAVGGYLYVMASAGQRPTGGYSVKITDVKIKGNSVEVQAQLGAPAPGQPVTAAVEYPKNFARIPYKGTEGLRVEFVLLGADKANPVDTPKTEAPKTDTAQQPGGVVEFQAITGQQLPASLQGWEGARGEAGASAQVVEGNLYVGVFAGEQRSGGYRVEIRKVELADGTVKVQAVLHKPAPGTMVTMALTYPRAYAKVSYQGATAPTVQVDWVK